MSEEVWCDNCGCSDPELVWKNSCGLVHCDNCCCDEEDEGYEDE